MAAGASEDDIDGAADWQAVADLAAGGTAGEETSGEPTPPPEPTKESVWYYNPVDPKTKKPVKKAVECEVVSVDKKTKTVTLKNLEKDAMILGANKTPMRVAWAELRAEA